MIMMPPESAPSDPLMDVGTAKTILGVLLAKCVMGTVLTIGTGTAIYSWWLTWPWSGLFLSTLIIHIVLRKRS